VPTEGLLMMMQKYLTVMALILRAVVVVVEAGLVLVDDTALQTDQQHLTQTHADRWTHRQSFEAEARAMRPRLRPKIIMKKVPNND